MNDQTWKKLGYSIPQAAEVASIGESVLRRAIDSGDLPRRYPSTRPIILASDLEKWLESLPTEPPTEGPTKKARGSRSSRRSGAATLQQVETLARSLGVSPESLLLGEREGE